VILVKDINVYNTKKFQANLLKKFNAIKNILNDLSVKKFLELEISENGIGLVEHKNIELLIKVLKAFNDFPDLKNFKLVEAINQVKNINNTKDLRTKYKLFKKIINSFIKNFENYEIKPSNKDLSVFLMDFLVYVLRLMYLEYENSSLVEAVKADDGEFDKNRNKTALGYTGPLFPKGEPNSSEVKQGLAKDCYLLSTLISLCNSKSGRTAIKKCFVDKENFSEQNYIKIRLYKVQLSVISPFDQDGKMHDVYLLAQKNGHIIIKLKKTELFYGKNSLFKSHQALPPEDKNISIPWVQLIEKAFAVYRFKDFVIGDEPSENVIKNWKKSELKISNIDWGLDRIVNCAITGLDTKSFIPRFENQKCLFKTISHKLEKGLPVMFSHKNSEENHTYSISSVKEIDGKKIIVIRDPYEEKNKEKEMEFSEFFDKFKNFTLTVGKKSKKFKKIDWQKY
jgi:hypothetical protein